MDILYIFTSFIGRELFWEEFSTIGYDYLWDLWIGFFIGIAVGVFGFIGINSLIKCKKS